MTTYAIGDIHGCFNEFRRLLETIDFDPSADHLWQVGDLVNGGPDSLSVLRWFAEHRHCTTVVLGNHDLHFLAVALTNRPPRAGDTFRPALNAPDLPTLVDWLRQCPLLVVDDDRQLAMVHAGLHPSWSIAHAQKLCREIETQLRSPTPEVILEAMYGNKPASPLDASTDVERWRTTINVTTRMRALDNQLGLDFTFKATYEDLPPKRMAWFDAPSAQWKTHRLICGHWSALGLRLCGPILALDSGCRWGGQLTAIDIDNPQPIQVDAIASSLFD